MKEESVAEKEIQLRELIEAIGMANAIFDIKETKKNIVKN